MSLFEGVTFLPKGYIEPRESKEITKYLYRSPGLPMEDSISNVNNLDELINQIGGVRMLSEMEVHGRNFPKNPLKWISRDSELSAELLARNDFWLEVKQQYHGNLYLCGSALFNPLWGWKDEINEEEGICKSLHLISDFAAEFLLTNEKYGKYYRIGKGYLFSGKDDSLNEFENYESVRFAFLDYMIDKTIHKTEKTVHKTEKREMNLQTYLSFRPSNGQLQAIYKSLDENTTTLQVKAIELIATNRYKDAFFALCALAYLDSIEFDADFVQNCETYIYPQWKENYDNYGKGIGYLKHFLYAYISGAYSVEEDHIYSSRMCLTLFYLLIEAQDKKEEFMQEVDNIALNTDM